MDTTITKQEAQQIASTIKAQLGGSRFVAMTGAKHFARDKDGSLSFMLPRGSAKNKINAVKIALNPMDLYNVTFKKINYRTCEVTTIEHLEGVFVEDLQRIFTEATGLYTHL